MDIVQERAKENIDVAVAHQINTQQRNAQQQTSVAPSAKEDTKRGTETAHRDT